MAKQQQQMTAVELLTEQHREVDKLFQEFEEAKDADDKQSIFDEIADKLAVHAKIEETHFYPAVRAKKTEDMVLEAFVEHTSIKRLLGDLLEADPEEASFDAQVKVLKEQVEHHVEEEEGQLFPAAKKVLDQDELEDSEPRNDIPEELARQQPAT